LKSAAVPGAGVKPKSTRLITASRPPLGCEQVPAWRARAQAVHFLRVADS
jgi:hypothetical protein